MHHDNHHMRCEQVVVWQTNIMQPNGGLVSQILGTVEVNQLAHRNSDVVRAANHPVNKLVKPNGANLECQLVLNRIMLSDLSPAEGLSHGYN